MAPEATHRHEEPGVRTPRVLMLVFGFVAFTAVLWVGLRFYYAAVIRQKGVAASVADFPAPRLQPNPTQDYTNFRAAQLRQLSGYGWVDRTKGLVHVPIERAMDLVAARGQAAYDPVEGTPPTQAKTDAPVDGAPRATPSPAVAPYGVGR